MNKTLAFPSILALGLLAAACTTAPVEYKYVGPGRELIKDADGHVVGQKEMLRDADTGEQYEHVTYFTPRRDAGGKIVGYEEPQPPGVVVRDLQGRRVGVRYTDLRSRGTNPRSDGVTVIITKPEE
ncbi:MAG TPA: hypothetical protein VE085_01620 [Burkholderiales bacterium]|nr:hypothetical protein [Burkholderiales bacterium]